MARHNQSARTLAEDGLESICNVASPTRDPRAAVGPGASSPRSLRVGREREGARTGSRPERNLAFVATALLTGLCLSELAGLDLGTIGGRECERRRSGPGRALVRDAPRRLTSDVVESASTSGPQSPEETGLSGPSEKHRSRR